MSDQPKRKNLGRGLDALLGEESIENLVASNNRETNANSNVLRTSIENVVPGKYQPRTQFESEELKALATSIRANGIIQPILVRENIGGPEDWEIVAGERRWRAAQMAQLDDVPIVTRTMTDSKALEIALVENLQRENLSPLDEAQAYKQLIEEFTHTPGELGDFLGKSRSHVANMLRLLTLNDEVKKLLTAGHLTAGHARALLNAENAAELAKDVVKKGLNVRQTEKLVKKTKLKSAITKSSLVKDANIISLEKELSVFLGLRVSIHDTNSRGYVTIEYETLEQFDDILARLKK